MQKIFIAIIFVVCQLISYSALALTVSSPPIYQVKASDFIEKFNTLNIQYRYNLKPIKKDENFQSKIIYLFKPNIYLDMNSVFELVGRLELTCEQFSNNKSTDMNKCQQSIQLMSKAFDPDFELSDFERNKVCESKHKTSWTAGSSGKVKLCSYGFNKVRYTQEHDLDDQSLRFTISTYRQSSYRSEYLRYINPE
ncbi:hypothetical protein ABX022_04150 [Snodgrassella alvi]|uniref:hypothetical protein n=1 Tax=Snodgrassella alvi TaxID=1196083 RepID=UPI00351C863A